MDTTINFTDRDGDTFVISNIRKDYEDGDCIKLSVSMNGAEPIETLEWLDDSGDITDSDSHLSINHSGFGWEAISSINSSLSKWLADTKEQRIDLTWWNESKTGSIEIGSFKSYAEAQNAIPTLEKELLTQCATEEECQNIRNGTWVSCAVDANENGSEFVTHEVPTRPEGVSEAEWKAHQERLSAKGKPFDTSAPAPASPKL